MNRPGMREVIWFKLRCHGNAVELGAIAFSASTGCMSPGGRAVRYHANTLASARGRVTGSYTIKDGSENLQKITLPLIRN
jgi:hypothetical protein